MARIEDIPQPTRDHIVALPCPPAAGEPFVVPPPLKASRIAILTSAALHPRSEMPFAAGTAEFRRLDRSVPAHELAMTHISINFDRNGFSRDINIAYPIDRLRELADDGTIGGVAETHYSVMGSTDPATMGETADGIAASLRQEGVDALILCPV